MEVAQKERLSFFEVQRTPPDEKRRREKAAEEAAKETPEILLLTPFASRPTIEFDRIKLGKSGIRKLLIRNPGDKPLDVLLDKLPKEEKGFNVDYVAFTLGGKEETSLLIGWTPTKAGGVRESIIVKFGGKFSAQLILIGSCVDPDAKKRQAVNSSYTKPLGPRNSNVKPGSRTRPSVASSKLNAPTAPKVSIPTNPVLRQQGSPPKRMFGDVEKENEDPRPMQPPSNPQGSKFICGKTFNPREFAKSDNFVGQSPRRETYVQERPMPSCGDIMESTPIVNREDYRRGDQENFDTRISNIMPPPSQDIRRQTFVPSKFALPSVSDACNDEDDVDYRRQTYVKLPPAPEAVINTRETYVKLPKPTEIVPAEQKPTEPLVESPPKDEEAPVNLSIAPLNLSAKPKALSNLLDQMNDVESEPLDLSLPSSESKDSKVSPAKEKKNITLNITESNFTPRRYCPRVSDISLPDAEESAPKSPVVKAPMDSKTPLKDPRLVQLMGAMNISGCGNLDLSFGSQFGDCSLAVNLASPARNRDMDFEEEDLEDIDENKENIDEEHELELIAKARGTSALGNRSESSTCIEKSPRLSTGTIVKSAPSVDAEMLPDVMEAKVSTVTQFQEEVCIEKHIGQVVYEEEIITNEVVEEVIELEFEIRDGKKMLVGERTLGTTVTKDIETICKTPTVQRRQAQCDISRMIEQHLGNSVPEQVKPRSVDLTDDKCVENPVFTISPHQAVDIDNFDKIDDTEVAVEVAPEAETVDKLPGLRGSPRISNQIAKHPDNFLCVTVNETSFLPPSPDDPRRCSTGVKNKEKMPSQTPSPNAIVRKSLFNNGKKEDSSPPDSVRLNSQGFVLPVITSDENDDQRRLSTDTYIAGGESPRLSTIQEEESVSKSNCQSSTIKKEDTIVKKDTEDVSDESEKSDKSAETESTSNPQPERKSLKPRRSMVTYNSRKIETLPKPGKSLDSYKKAAKESEETEGNGLMFISLSPGTNEKRKPEVTQSKQEQTKRTKTVPASVSSYSRPTIRAVKNPTLQKPTPSSSKSKDTSIIKSRESQASKPVKPTSRSLPPRQPVSRLVTNTRKLTLNQKVPRTIHHPNPFASRNMYYDEKWVEKQERGFSKWLNFFLTPQLLDDGEASMPKTIDIANLWSQCSRDVKEPRAPTKEQMSLRQYTVRTEMNRLRKMACRIWQSKEVATVIRKVELEIEKLRLAVRKDRNMTKDVGMKQSLLKLILSYNPLWLRIGLETVYGEILPLNSNSDLLSLSRFLITRWLSNPDILSEFAHPSVPHSYRDGCQDALNKFALKKFLELVYFLDIAKETKLIRHNPCLFHPDSQFKSSREVLIIFAKDYLAGEGDITKHMAYMNYILSHKQTKLDEFDFAVTNIKTDLRCGVRLAKVAELLSGDNYDLMTQLRVPTVSRLQKVHNMDIALGALRQGGAEIRQEISGKDLVDGHREKTLELLWSVIFGYQLATLLNLDNIKEEIDHLRRSLSAKARLGDVQAKSGMSWLQSLLNRSPPTSVLAGERLDLLLEWVRLVLIHYNVQIDNWTTSWCDGRALCLLVHHYQPQLLDITEVKEPTTITHQANNQNLDDSLDFSYGNKNLDAKMMDTLVENERSNFKLLLQRVSMLGGVPVLITPGDMSNTIPDEKVTATFIGYLAVRLLDLSREIKAARIIQLAWRKFYAVRKEEQLKVKYNA